MTSMRAASVVLAIIGALLGGCGSTSTPATAQPGAGTPTFAPVGGAYMSPQSVSLSTTTPGAEIRYTVTGQTPTAASPLYVGPIAVSESMIVRAIAVAPGFTSSPIASEHYYVADLLPFSGQGCLPSGSAVGPSAPSFSRPGPAAYVDSLGLTRTCVENEWRQSGSEAGVAIEAPESLTWTLRSPLPTDWCIDGVFTPLDTQPDGFSRARSFWQLGSSGTSNSAGLWIDGTAGRVHFAVYDGAGAAREATYDFGASSAIASARLTACVVSGAPRIWLNGAEVGSLPTGAGHGTWASAPTNFRLGYSESGGTKYLNGTARAIRVCPGAPMACTQAVRTERWLALSDSIFNTSGKWLQITQRLSDQSITVDRGTNSGITSGQGLMELADEVYAWGGSSWDLQTRGTPISAYSTVFLGYGANDAGYTVQATRRAYDKLVSQAMTMGMNVVIGAGPPPRADAGLTSWDAAADVYDSAGHRAAAEAVRTKYGAASADVWTRFKNEVAEGRAIVAQLMADQVHPNESGGARVIGQLVHYAALNPGTSVPAAPEVEGRTLVYLFGRPAVGTWTRVLTPMTNTPHVGPLGRIASLPDQANVTSDASARVEFPPVPVGTQQVWACWLTGPSSGNIFPTWNRGQPDQFFVSIGTTGAYANYPACKLVWDGDPLATPKTLDIDGVCTNTCRILGVVYVGVP